jgi:hypothetical protein
VEGGEALACTVVIEEMMIHPQTILLIAAVSCNRQLHGITEGSWTPPLLLASLGIFGRLPHCLGDLT